MFTTLACISLLGCLLAVLPAWQHPHWLIRDIEFARLQLTLLLLLCLMLQLPGLLDGNLPQKALGSLTLVGTAWCAWPLRRYFPLWPKEVGSVPSGDDGGRLRLLTANVEMENRDAAALLQLVDRCMPDLVVTMESDQWWEAQLSPLEERFPHSVKVPLDNRYGMHLYSQLELNNPERRFLVEKEIPSIHTQVILRSGQAVQLHLLHPAPPSPTENTEASERDAEIIVVARRLAPVDAPTIVAGDFNDIPWSRTSRLFCKISGLLDPRVGRGLFNTFHARIPVLRWPLDHLYHSAHFGVAALQRLPAIGSDHFPMLTELAVVSTVPREGVERLEPADLDTAKEITERREVEPGEVPVPGRES